VPEIRPDGYEAQFAMKGHPFYQRGLLREHWHSIAEYAEVEVVIRESCLGLG
jgi:hypothetical protein